MLLNSIKREFTFNFLEKNKNVIIKRFNKYNKKALNLNDLSKILNSLLYSFDFQEEDFPFEITRTFFIDFLINRSIINEVQIHTSHRTIKRYIYGNPNNYEIAVSLFKNSYLTHYTAMFLHDLTLNIPKVIYINHEQSEKIKSNASNLKQINIDKAFSRPVRKSNNIAYLDNNTITILNGMYSGNLGVNNIKINNTLLPITSIERTLIDIVVRPDYSGGVDEVLKAFIKAKEKVSIGTLIATMNNLNFIYPYHQSIGFYLEKANYPENILKRLDIYEKHFNFYLTHEMIEPSFSKRWNVYYPNHLE